MAWRDELRPGSFRGAAFKTDSAVNEGGRRLAVHEYPERDTPFVEDMGRKVKRWSFSAYVIGPDYMSDRDALEAALDQAGPGTLVHPYRGTFQVAIESYRRSETAEEGGKCAFEITYIESGSNTYPAPSADTASGVLSAADANSAGAATSFGKRYRWSGMPDYVIGSASDALRDIAAAVSGLGRSSPTATAADLTSALLDLHDNAPDIARSDTIPDVVGTVLMFYRQSQSDPAVAQAGLKSLGDFTATPPAIYVPTANRATEIGNLQAIGDLVQALAVTEQAKATLAQTYASYDDAVAARNGMSEDLETVITAAGDRGDDDMYGAASDLKTAVVVDLTARGASLARIVYRSFNRPMNTLVLAQRLYQDSSRNLEIAARNPTPHPGFLPVTIEALSR